MTVLREMGNRELLSYLIEVIEQDCKVESPERKGAVMEILRRLEQKSVFQLMPDLLVGAKAGDMAKIVEKLPLLLAQQESTPSSKPDEWIPASNVYGAYIKAKGKPEKFVKQKEKKDRKNLCNYCPDNVRGLCCYFSDFIKGVQIVVDEHCKFLNEETGWCTVYKERFQKNHNCLTIEKMKELGTLPRKCPYIQFDSEYQKREDLRLYFDEFEIIAKERD